MAKQPNYLRPSKVRPVAIALMRVPPAYHTQRPFRKAHGDKIAAELDLDKIGLMVINHRDGIYWVLDGQHRLYALKQREFETYDIECRVYEGMTDAEMAEMFLGLDDRKAIAPFDKFHIACTANRVRETDIRRIVEAQGLKISRAKDVDCISAISALGKVYDRAGAVVLGQTLRTIKHAYGGDTNSFDSQVIEGVGLVFNRYNGLTSEKDLASRLGAAKYGVRGLLQRAEDQRLKTGNQKSQCVAAVVVELYNKGTGPRAAKRLANWWKQAPDETATE